MSDDEIKAMFIRLPVPLHADLVLMAKDDDRSLHNLILTLLKAAVAVWKAKQKATA